MAETDLTDAEALALAGTADSGTGIEIYRDGVGAVPGYLDDIRELARIIALLRPIQGLRCAADGDLTVMVYAGT